MPHTQRSRSVLIVDDSGSTRTVARLALERGGYAVVEAVDGDDAVSKLEAQKFSLVLCDLRMPNMDGFDFVKQLRNDHAHKFTPVIMLTTESTRATKTEGRQAGIKAWMVKPFVPSELLAAVDRLCL